MYNRLHSYVYKFFLNIPLLSVYILLLLTARKNKLDIILDQLANLASNS